MKSIRGRGGLLFLLLFFVHIHIAHHSLGKKTGKWHTWRREGRKAYGREETSNGTGRTVIIDFFGGRILVLFVLGEGERKRTDQPLSFSFFLVTALPY